MTAKTNDPVTQLADALAVVVRQMLDAYIERLEAGRGVVIPSVQPVAESRQKEPDSELPLLLRVAHAAELLSIGRAKAYELTRTGELPTVRLGRSVRVPRDEPLEYIQDKTERLEW